MCLVLVSLGSGEKRQSKAPVSTELTFTGDAVHACCLVTCKVYTLQCWGGGQPKKLVCTWRSKKAFLRREEWLGTDRKWEKE
jgi:hypothetical protein